MVSIISLKLFRPASMFSMISFARKSGSGDYSLMDLVQPETEDEERVQEANNLWAMPPLIFLYRGKT